MKPAQLAAVDFAAKLTTSLLVQSCSASRDLGPGESYGVSANGTYVVGTFSPWIARAFLWSEALGMQDLGALAPNSYSIGRGVSDEGSVVVACPLDAAMWWRAFRWTAVGGMQDLGALGNNGSYAYGVSPEGHLVVGWSDGWYRWTALDGMQAIVLHGTMYPDPRAVSSGGTVVGGTARVNGNVHAYLWTFRPPMPFGSRHCAVEAVPNSTGCRRAINLAGSQQVATNSLQLIAEQLPPFSFDYFLTSWDQGSTFPVNNSQGRLCLGGFIGRYVGHGQIKNSGTSGSFSLAIDLTSMPQPFGNVAVQPGDTWNFQAWYRDANPGPTSNLTDAVAVTLQ